MLDLATMQDGDLEDVFGTGTSSGKPILKRTVYGSAFAEPPTPERPQIGGREVKRLSTRPESPTPFANASKRRGPEAAVIITTIVKAAAIHLVKIQSIKY